MLATFCTKILAPLVLLLGSAVPVAAQSLFFDQLPTTRWVVPDSQYRALSRVATIHLRAVRDTTHTPPPATVTWLFRSRLLVRRYEAGSGRMVTLGTYAYRVDQTRRSTTLLIFLDDQTPVRYTVGISSAGSLALLLRQRSRRRPG